MSEDPPVAVVAVDTADKIAAPGRPGRRDDDARTGHPRTGPTDRPGRHRPRRPDTAKLTIYVGRQQRVSGRPAHHAVCDALHRHGFAGAAVFLGVDGTAHGQRHRARFFSRNVDVPVMVIAVGTGDQVAEAIPELESLLRRPLMTVERAQLCKRDGQLACPARGAAGDRRQRAAAVAEADDPHLRGHPA